MADTGSDDRVDPVPTTKSLLPSLSLPLTPRLQEQPRSHSHLFCNVLNVR